MNTTTTSGTARPRAAVRPSAALPLLSGMTAAVGAAMVLSGFTGLPLLLGVAMVIAAIAVTFAAAVLLAALFAPARRPVSMRRTRRLRAAA